MSSISQPSGCQMFVRRMGRTCSIPNPHTKNVEMPWMEPDTSWLASDTRQWRGHQFYILYENPEVIHLGLDCIGINASNYFQLTSKKKREQIKQTFWPGSCA